MFVFPSLAQLLGVSGPYLTGGRPQRPSNHRLAQESCPRKNALALSVEPCGETSLSPAVRIQQGKPCQPLVKGLRKSVIYKERPIGTPLGDHQGSPCTTADCAA